MTIMGRSPVVETAPSQERPVFGENSAARQCAGQDEREQTMARGTNWRWGSRRFGPSRTSCDRSYHDRKELGSAVNYCVAIFVFI